MISEKLGGIYSGLENKFYSFFDFLEEKGLPVYSLIDPIEEKGIPFFPLTICLIAVLLFAVFGFGVVGTGFESSIELNLKDSYGKGISGVNIKIEDGTGKELFSGLKNNGDDIKIKVSGGAELTFKAEKTGYKGNETTIKIINKEEIVSLKLKKIINTIQAKIKFYDKETETTISNVRTSIEWKGRNKNGISDSGGLAEFLDIPLEEDLFITAIADSYYEYKGSIRFESEETKSVYLTPKEIAFQGESNLIITLFDQETSELIENSKVKVFDATSNDLIDERIVSDGVYSENFPKGMIARFTIEKEGYKLFESNEFTLRGEEENLGAVELEKGGKELQVKAVYSDTKNPVVGAEITLFNSENQTVNSSYTLYEGIAEFKGLDEKEEYFIGAEKEGYLPEMKRVEKDSEEIELTKASSSNSGELLIIVVSPKENPVENASLYFTQTTETEITPLGFGVKHTDETGKLKLNIPIGTEVTVKAAKDLMQGNETLLIQSAKNNNLIIRLEKKDSVKSIKFFDEKGQILGGNLIIKTKNGEILFDGETEKEMLFDAQENNFVEIELTTKEGKKYSEEINLEGKEELEINFDSREINEQTPEIEFIGIYDIAGNEVEGITKGKEYILKFKTTWSKGLEKGGIHFRTGSNSIKYADSENIGITGFDGATNNFFYGRSFTPTPSPGYKEIDYSNKGQGGKLNKLIELYYNNPEGTKIIKVRIKARETITQETIRIKYRAWSTSNGYYNRNPFDSVLDKAKETEEKQSLYADTKEIEIKVYDSEPECMEEICAEYKLIGEDGREFNKKEFFGIKGKVYAIEMQLEARKATEATFKLNTSNENPRIAFTGSETRSFSQFIDNNKSNTSIEFKTVVSREGTKARVYFKAKEQGESFIKSLIVSPKDSMTENFYFKIFEERIMEVTAPKTINQGQDFEVTVKDEKGKGIENAEIIFYNSKGRIEKTVISAGFNGKNGKYEIENNLKPGKYLIKVKSNKFREEEKEIQVVFGKGLETEETTIINIPANEKFISKKVKIKNSTEQVIEGLSAEIVPAGNFPKEFKLSARPPNSLNPNEENEIELMIEYSGNAKAVLHGEAETIITGTIKGIPIRTTTKIKINYNQKLNENCLEFDRSELKEYLVGSGGNSRQLELGLKNNCGIPLEFEIEAVPKRHADREIEFSSGRIRIAKDEIKTIKIRVINKIQRNFIQQQTIEYDVFFNSSQLTKSIPAKIILWHEMFALNVSPSVVLWLTQGKRGQEAIAAQPLFIRNTGLADIQNITFATQFNKPGNTKIKVTYAYTSGRGIPELKRGMALIPPAVLEARTDTTENQKIIGKVSITGNINGKEYLLREINVFVNVSAGWSCLEAWSDDMQFYSPNAEFGSIDKTLNIVNNCLEPVIIQGVEPEKIGGNEIILADPGYVLQPGAKDEFTLRLIKKSETNKKIKLKVVGVGRHSIPATEIYSMPFEIDIAIGKGSGTCGSETEPCKWENTTTLEYCDTKGTATLYFPKQSENCSEGYCDAEQLGRFLAEKIEEEIRKAQMRISDVKSVENLGAKCELRYGYCSFGALGVSTNTFDFYLKNDQLTKEMLESEIKKLRARETKSLYINYGETEEELYSVAGSSFGEHLMLLPSIRGCGRYTAKFIGAVAINGNEIRKDSMTLLLKIEKGREETPECFNKIQNFMNFLPVDKSYAPGAMTKSWLGVIIKDPKIEELQKSFSMTLFKDDKGLRVTTNHENNFIRFNKGNFDQTKGIVKIAMERKGASDSPKQLDIYITDKYYDSGEEVEKDIASEAGLIISNLKNGVIKQGCISQEMDYLILGSVKNISEIANLRWTDNEKFINLYPKSYSCAKLKMSSKIEAPEAEVSWQLASNELTGVIEEETVFRHNNEEEITNKGEKSFNLSKALWKEAGTNYELEYKLCFKGSENPRAAKNSKIKLEVTGLKERTLKFGVCAISPVEFMENAFQITEPGSYYATVDWKGEPEKVPIQIIRDAYYAKYPEKHPAAIREKEIGTRKWIGLGGYVAGSVLGYLLAAPLTGGASLGAAVIDIGLGTLPAVAIAAFSSGGEVMNTTKNEFKNGLESIGVEIDEIDKVQEETGLSDSEFFWELSKLHAYNLGAKETVKALIPVSQEAKIAAQAAKELSKVGAKDLIDEFAVIDKDLKGYNGAKNAITTTRIERIGTFTKGVQVAPSAGNPIDVSGKKFIEIVDPATGTRNMVIDGVTDPLYTGFDTKQRELIKALEKVKIKGNPINAGQVADDAFRSAVVGSPSGGANPVFLVDDQVGQGIITELEEWGAKVDAKAALNNKEGKALLEMKNKFIERTQNQLNAGKKVTAPPGASKTALTKALGEVKAVSAKNKIISFFERHQKITKTTQELGKGIGQWTGGLVGWTATNAFLGDYEEIPLPEAEGQAVEFEKTKTYKVKIGTSAKTGKPTYSYSLVQIEDLANIPYDKRLDKDSCNKPLKELSEELIKRYNKLIEEENK